MTKKKSVNFLFIQMSFLIYSVASLLSKLAGLHSDSIYFFIFYGASFICLGLYAFCWQKILSKNSLIFAYLNKGVTLLWGILFGYFIFGEPIKFTMILGILIVLTGVAIIQKGDK